MPTMTSNFYRFCGVHSLLIGILPFFIPVLLWQQGFELAEISLFITMTGVSFLVSLSLWRRLYLRQQWRQILMLSFIAELGLVGALSIDNNSVLLVVAAILNGVYNCFYWTTQRVMFSAMTIQNNSKSSSNQTGKHYGNFQILVVILLKIGILVGAYLQQHQEFWLLWLLSFILSLFGLMLLLRHYGAPDINTVSQISTAPETSIVPETNPSQAKPHPLSLRHKLVFVVDGVFLFFESYFWILSLFFISHNNIFELGLMVVILTISLSVIFMLIKNKIDGLNHNYVFYCAVVLYAVSWALRGSITEDISSYSLYLMVLLIAFLTSFFRLSFNKRFYDQANQGDTLSFLLAKSYLSQGGIVIFFAILAGALTIGGQSAATLSLLYWLLVPAGFTYGLYAPTRPIDQHQQQIIAGSYSDKPLAEHL